ncbi:hypothetical protein J2W70_001259 [Pseudomonas koreensis]|nr:hypothetical protein [Pseudomonas koreensis]
MRSGLLNCLSVDWPADPQTHNPRRSPVGASLLANAFGLAVRCLMCRRLREQARSHTGYCGLPGFGTRRENCGSGLARECIRSGDEMLNVPPSSRASPLPHWILWVAGIWHAPRTPVGAGLLANAFGLAVRCLMCRRLREQARSHTGYCGLPGFGTRRKNLWERACSRMHSVRR